jgi:hypothetical protein
VETRPPCLRDGDGHEEKLLSTKQAIEHFKGEWRLTILIRVNSSESDFSAYAIDLKTPLSATELRRQGFIFFQAPDKSPVRSPRGLVLSISGLPQALQITIN